MATIFVGEKLLNPKEKHHEASRRWKKESFEEGRTQRPWPQAHNQEAGS